LRLARGRKNFFFEKKKQKTFASPAVERPQYGHSKAGGIKSFFGYFFQKK
jgi:hypothetical protein